MNVVGRNGECETRWSAQDARAAVSSRLRTRSRWDSREMSFPVHLIDPDLERSLLQTVDVLARHAAQRPNELFGR